ncbi:DNA-binding protein with winged-HTH domain [Shewanella psychrophila]|uniref:DNA-binding protein with winged-HTH domain n=1 Tax=Shewanella psychrophila TaxID=225848 RepID=A0A1S6HX74_9GAMM|nr:winged helix-turn-helix domain-containing protein [Shewanella psychrophila]AQS40018.1 DNA-binding protein with winged-HTH domain [Shewanella psychrophila]
MITQPRYRLADRLIDPSQCTILKDGILLKVELRAMQVLLCLIKHADEPVSRDMLLEEVWSGGEVSDNAINRIIGLLRNQLGDNAKSPSFIKTLPKVGYVLIAEISLVEKITREEKFTEEVIVGSKIDDINVASKKILKRKLFTFLYEHSGKFVFVSLGLVILFSWLAFQYLSGNNSGVIPLKATELKRLTYLDGQEFTPALSTDGRYLAFSHRILGDKNWKVGIKSLETGTINYLKGLADSQGYPAFSPDGSRLAYLSFNQVGGCKINVVNLENGEFGSIKTITTCKSKMQATSIAWKPSGKSLFYIDEDHNLDYLSEKKVFSVSLNGSNKLQISQPFSIGRGDYALSLSPNGRFLAVIRNIGWYNAQVMLLSLETGDWKNLFSVDFLPHTVAWSRNSDSLIYRGESGNLTRYIIDTKTHEQLTQIMQPIISPVSNKIGDIVAVIGDFYNSEIWRVEDPFKQDASTLKGGGSSTVRFIYSNRKDRNGIITKDGREMVFVSERTGVPQLWLKNSSGDEVQLTFFSRLSFIRDISLSDDGHEVLGLINNKPFIYSLESRDINYINIENFNSIYGLAWGADSSTIIVSVDVSGLSKLKHVDVTSGKVISTLVDGGEFGKYLKPRGVYFTKRLQEGLWTLEHGKEKLIVDDFVGMSNASWVLINDYVYNLVYTDGHFYLERTNIVTGKNEQRLLPFDDIRGDSISVDNDGNVFLVISKPSNVDIIRVNY